MSLSSKILIFLGFIIFIGTAGFIVFKLNEISNRQKAIETQVVAQKELVDNIMRSQNKYATKEDVENFAKDNNVNLKAIKDDLDNLHAELNAVNVVTFHSGGQVSTNVPSTSTGPVNPNPINPNNPDPFGYMKKEQKLSLNENFANVQIPFGEVGFSAWQEKPWSINIKPREYKVVNVIGTDDNQRSYVYNKVSIKVDNKDYDVKITSAETKQEFPEAKFSFWNPRLFLTAGGGINLTQAPIQGSATAGVTLGIMSYGKYKTNPTVSVLQVGVGYETGTQRPAVIVNPVNFNIGGLLPNGLANNTYVGPSLQVDTAGNIIAGGALSIGF